MGTISAPHQRQPLPPVTRRHQGGLRRRLTDKIAEQEARNIDHKWCPVRHHKNEFTGIGFDGDALRVYARIYSRDLYLYGYTAADEVPEMDAVFVLSIGTGDENDDVYNELRDQLGAFVETSVVETDLDIDNA